MFKVTKKLNLRARKGYNKKRGKTKYLTGREYYNYQTQQRVKHTNILPRSRKLFHKFLVDAVCKIEQNELNHLNQESIQKKFRTESFNVLQDALDAGDSLDNYGKKVILPSSFTRGPRYRQQRFQDSMAIVREYGKPDLFITMTANPAWDEIKDSLLPNQKPKDRPDIVNRIFYLKVKHLLHLVRTKEVFGPISALIWVIEFQKRGLPHVHMLVTLKNKLRTPDAIDNIIKAEIPDPSQPELQRIVLQNMIHGPCGHDNLAQRQQPCMKKYRHADAICNKRFPAPLIEATVFKDDGTNFIFYFYIYYQSFLISLIKS